MSFTKKFKIDFSPVRDVTSLASLSVFFLLLLLLLSLQQFSLFFQLFFGLIFTYAIVIIIRTLYYRDRPNKQEYKNWVERMDASSFPSLHTARAFFLALMLSHFFNQKYATIFFIFLACLISGTRIYMKKHDWIDVLGGVVLGVITFWLSTIIF